MSHKEEKSGTGRQADEAGSQETDRQEEPLSRSDAKPENGEPGNNLDENAPGGADDRDVEDIVDKSKRLIDEVITQKRERAKTGETEKEEKEEKEEKDEKPKKPDKQKRAKRATRKELLELIQRKNSLLQKMEKAIEVAAQEVVAKDDKLVRMAAEFENYKKRTRREWELLQQKANAELIKDILGVLDDFERAFEAAGDTEDHFHHGIRMIYKSLLDMLIRTGLKEVEAENERFDPQFHEAVGEIETDSAEEGHVANVVQKGYLFNDILLRPVKVIVAKEKK